MKKYAILVIAILAIVVFASGCTNSGTNTYNNSGISFQYPGEWSTNYTSNLQQSISSNNMTTLVSLGKDNAGIFVAKKDTGSANVSLDNFASAFKSNIQSSGFSVISENTTAIDGNNAKQFVLNDSKSGLYFSFNAFQKNKNLYFVVIATPDNNQQTVNMILNSFKIQ